MVSLMLALRLRFTVEALGQALHPMFFCFRVYDMVNTPLEGHLETIESFFWSSL